MALNNNTIIVMVHITHTYCLNIFILDIYHSKNYKVTLATVTKGLHKRPRLHNFIYFFIMVIKWGVLKSAPNCEVVLLQR